MKAKKKKERRKRKKGKEVEGREIKRGKGEREDYEKMESPAVSALARPPLVSRQHPSQARAPPRKNSQEQRHQFSAQPGDGKVSLVDRCQNIYQRLYTYWVTNE